MILLLILLLSSTLILHSAPTDTITPSQTLAAEQTIISTGGTFELGFFNATTPSSSFLGIWYHKIPIRKMVWVANRKSPITAQNATFSLTSDGNILITAGDVNNGGIRTVWSTNTSGVKIPSLKLLDSGNLVLTDGGSNAIIWASFDYPSDTLLPNMELGLDLKRHLEKQLMSWKSPNDPSPGLYTFGLRQTGSPELILKNGSNIEYRTGPWTGVSWSGIPQMNSDVHFNFIFVVQPDKIFYTDTVTDNKSEMTLTTLDPSGGLQRLMWLGGQWRQYWRLPEDKCDGYGTCGAFGICSMYYPEGVCKCLQGFEPRTVIDWTLRDYSGGCKRGTALACSGRDGFVKVSAVKPPDTENVTVVAGLGVEDCGSLCLGKCSCVAYVVLGGNCLWWVDQLVDTKKFPQGTQGGVDLYLRLAAADLVSAESASSKRKHIVAVVIPVGLAFIIFSCCGIYTIRKKRKQGHGYAKGSIRKEMELPVFDMSAIEIATNNFSDENKLGQGGFGPVYKGHFEDGQEIAVKRLSRNSVQGLDEFMNEVMLIAKLQHRNLVRLLGCCIQGEERLLIYEYMPNKSLDSFIFADKAVSSQLGWQKRFDIILGIARGLLYLHQDSRLKIIHRDLKVSNILLDKELNPKISDFGMARIVGGDQMQESTQKVVGTFGYMSPEYAMQGIFSVKSDVFSFGVIVLEVLTGKKNRVFDPNESHVSLVGHAWTLWLENKSLELIEDALKYDYHEQEVLRCMQVGLLCVQEGSEDRPTMASVILMLGSEAMTLPQPKRPGFYLKDDSKVPNFLTPDHVGCTRNDITLTMIHGR
ncbi:receptor-like serine/threonine-protein kinase SD1-8 isoform X3 [Dendrobium catenatum]|uniref:receptor-like serine/threonine-protein kinase SD1-8 isoform X3 n=1 Tax=Dendrobium catenatum TaxID=906689 RepID=UPI0009F4EE71|nr:receptor-like serine/threonine-protein kinase SD1-8 isoform X3 [Dendrobium catenatum]